MPSLALGLALMLVAFSPPSSAAPRARRPGAARAVKPAEPKPPPTQPSLELARESRTVVVTGTRTERGLADTTVATQVLDRKALEASGAENLAEALEEQPGVQITRAFGGAGGAGIQLQGLDPKYTLVLIDGQRVTGSVNGVVDLSRFPAEDIEQIEIVKGPSAALYGADAIAGVVNVITRKQRRPREAELHTTYGSYNTADITGHVGMQQGKVRTRMSSGWHRTDGFDRNPADVQTTGNASDAVNATHTLEARPRSDTKVTTAVDFLRRELRGVDLAATGAVFDRSNRTHTLGATLTWEKTWTAPARLRLSAHAAHFSDRYALDQRNADALDELQKTRDTLGQFGAQYDHVLGRHAVTTGLEGQVEHILTPRLETGSGLRGRYAVFAQDEWTVLDAPRLVLLPGARLDYDTQFGGAVTPRLSLRFDPHRTLVLRASYGHGFRAPSFRELYLSFANASVGYRVTGNDALRPEHARGFTASVEWRPHRVVMFGAGAFVTAIRDLITVDAGGDVALVGSVFRYVNIGAARTRGAEASFGLRAGEWLSLDGSYTFTEALDMTIPRPLPGRPAHQGSARLLLKHPRWGTQFNVRAAIRGKQFYYEDRDGDGVDETREIPPYATLDLRLSQSIRGRVDLFVGVDNLLDAGDAGYLPIFPRSFYGGLTIRHGSPGSESR